MVAIVVALALQVLWQGVRVALGQTVGASGGGHVVTLSAAIILATHLAVAAGALGLSRRHTGLRRAGAWLAAGGYLAIAATTAVYACLPPATKATMVEIRWVIAMYHYGWNALAVLSISGFAMAAGRRGLWLGPLAIGCAFMHDALPLTPGTTTLVFGGLASALVAVMAWHADRRGTVAPAEPDAACASSGLRHGEVLAWLSAGMSIVSILLEIVHPGKSIYISLPWACVSVVVQLCFVGAAWSIARARIAAMPAWLWYLAATCTLAAAMRTARSWLLTVMHHWGDLDGVKLVSVHWSAHVPSILGMAAALLALALFARRRGTREISVAALVTAAFVVVVFSVRVVLGNDVIANAGCFVIANLAAARIYRATRRELGGRIPAARVIG